MNKTERLAEARNELVSVAGLNTFMVGKQHARFILRGDDIGIQTARARIAKLQNGSSTFGDDGVEYHKFDALRGFKPGESAIGVKKNGAEVFYHEIVGDSVSYFAFFNILAADRRYDNVRIVTGPCLFGAANILARQADGRNVQLVNPIVDGITENVTELEIPKTLSVYEIEYLYRVGSFIGRYMKNNPAAKEVMLNIPKYEYYVYALPAYNHYYLSAALMLKFIHAVEDRTALIESSIKRMVNLISKRDDISFTALMPMYVLGEEIKRRVRCMERGVDFEKALGILKGSAAFGDMYGALEVGLRQEVKSYSEADDKRLLRLNYLSYAIAELYAAKNGKNKLAIAVENPEEQSIFERAKSCMGREFRGERFSLVGIYLQRNLVPRENLTENAGNAELYFLKGEATEEIEETLSEYYKAPNMGFANPKRLDKVKSLLRRAAEEFFNPPDPPISGGYYTPLGIGGIRW